MMIDDLVSSLKDEFSGEIMFAESVPSNPVAPSVVVAPGDPFLVPDTHGLVRESWDVLVVANFNASDKGVKQLRELSLRVKTAVHKVGAVWHSATGPKVTGENKNVVVSVNSITFRYNPDTLQEE